MKGITCEECRFRASSALQPDADVAEHLATCTACADFYQKTQRLDNLFKQALQREIAAVEPRSSSRTRLIASVTAIAAGVILIVGLVAQRYVLLQQPLLPNEIAKHIAAEPAALVRAPGTAIPSDTQKVLAAAHLHLRPGQTPVINYIMQCQFNGKNIVHIVVQDANGPATILVMTEERAIRRSEHFHVGDFSGVIEPTAHGAIAVLSSRGDVDAIARHFLSALEFKVS